MIVARARDREAKKILIIVHRRDYCGENEQKQRVFLRFFPRVEQVFALRGAERPVVVLAASVHALERFFVQKAGERVLVRDLFHKLHRQLIVVDRYICRREDGRELVLVLASTPSFHSSSSSSDINAITRGRIEP